MSTQHTPEPWDAERSGIYGGVQCVAMRHPQDEGEFTDNARRIVACVNACAGIPTEALEAGVVGEMIAKLQCLKDVYQFDHHSPSVLRGQLTTIVGRVVSTLASLGSTPATP